MTAPDLLVLREAVDRAEQLQADSAHLGSFTPESVGLLSVLAPAARQLPDLLDERERLMDVLHAAWELMECSGKGPRDTQWHHLEYDHDRLREAIDEMLQAGWEPHEMWGNAEADADAAARPARILDGREPADSIPEIMPATDEGEEIRHQDLDGRARRAAVVDTRVMFHTTATVRLGDVVRHLQGAGTVEIAIEALDHPVRSINFGTPYGWLKVPEDDLGGPVPDMARLTVTIEVADG